MTDIIPDWDYILDLADGALPFGITWDGSGVAEFSPERDGHAFIVGRPRTGKTVAERSMMLASLAHGYMVFDRSSLDLPARLSIRDESNSNALARAEAELDRRLDSYDEDADTRAIVFVGAEQFCLFYTGKVGKLNTAVKSLTRILREGPAVGMHVVLISFAADLPEFCHAETDLVNELRDLLSTAFKALLGEADDAQRADLFGHDIDVTIAAPGYPGGGVIQHYFDGSTTQFRGYFVTHEDVMEQAAEYANQ